MHWTGPAALLLAILGSAAAQFRSFPGGRQASQDFDCPEDFGYYAHPADCSKYFVCVFGGALEETCTAGLLYSDELLTCDWPRNVPSCDPASSTPRPQLTTVRITDPRTRQTPRFGAATSPRGTARTTTPAPRARAAAVRRPSPRRPSVPNSLTERTRARGFSSTRRAPARDRSAATTRARGFSSTRRAPARDPSAADIAERVRLLDDIDQRPLDLERGFEGENNKIVTRRQQKLLSPNSSSGRGRFQQPAVQSLQDNTFREKGNNNNNNKGTPAPVRLSTLSSFSFGDTGTRFPPRVTALSTEATRFPPRQPEPAVSTFVSSTRNSLLPAVTSTPATTVTQATVGSPELARTEPAYVAYVNDTIYDVYYIYDDDDLVYDDEVVTDSRRTTADSRRTTADSRRTTADNRRTTTTEAATEPTTKPAPVTPAPAVKTVRPAPTTPRRRVTARPSERPSARPTRRPAGTRSLFPSRRPAVTVVSTSTPTVSTTTATTTDSTTTTTTTATDAPTTASKKFLSIVRPSFSASTSRKTSTAELTSPRGSTLGGTRSSTLGGTRSSTLGGTRSSTFVPPSRPSTRRGSSASTTRGSAAKTERGRSSFVRPSSARTPVTSSSRRTPSTGLKSIDSPRRSSVSSLFPKKNENAVHVPSKPKRINIWEHPPRRPEPLFPQPEPDTPAERCDARCKLPDCSCGGTATPGGLEAKATPQLVLLTFDDSINDINRVLYEEMFEVGRKNPNGCPISATYYLSHEWTDYKQVQNLYADGHEIASHSISHSFGEQFSTSKWEDEIAGQREIIAAYGGVKLEDVRGMRAPFLSIGGNRMFKMLYNNNFTYDSSMPVYENKPPSWPYTLDYQIHHDCMIPPCPNKAYPGVWEVPMVMWQDLSGGRCSMVDACTTPKTAEDVYKMMIKNFERHYTTNRAIFPLYFHAAWMTTEHHKEGFMAFLDTVSKMEDVWLVTNWQALQWMRDPQPLGTVNNFQPFGCDYPDRKRCVKPKKCNLWHKSGVRYMTTCQPCPDKYPWTKATGVAPRP